jgi:integrase
MASLEFRGETYHVFFRYAGKKFRRSLKTGDEKTAAGWLAAIEETLRDITRGKIPPPPPGADVAGYLLAGGKVADPPAAVPEPEPEPLKLDDLFQAYFDSLPEGSRERSTLDGMQIHRRHLIRIFGAKFAVENLTLDDLQRYVKKRSGEKGQKGRKLDPATISKGLVTFRTVWNWGVRRGMLAKSFPKKNEVILPKSRERQPFRTRAEIQEIVDKGTLSKAERIDLWEGLYLSSDELERLLDYVEKLAERPRWVYPAIVMAAHTGARRSEIIRSQVADVAGDQLVVHERKRVRGALSSRRVPISRRLRQALDAWLAEHPGGNWLFCQQGKHDLDRSQPATPVTVDVATDNVKRVLKDSEWSIVRGWHVFRHSFISACATRGVDQRMVEEWAGHSSTEISRIYRHLAPHAQYEAFGKVFDR